MIVVLTMTDPNLVKNTFAKNPKHILQTNWYACRVKDCGSLQIRVGDDIVIASTFTPVEMRALAAALTALADDIRDYDPRPSKTREEDFE